MSERVYSFITREKAKQMLGEFNCVMRVQNGTNLVFKKNNVLYETTMYYFGIRQINNSLKYYCYRNIRKINS